MLCLREGASDKRPAAFRRLLTDSDLERVRREDAVDVAEFLTEKPAVRGVVDAVHVDNRRNGIHFTAGVFVLINDDFRGLDDGPVLNVFQRESASARVDVHGALVEIFRGFEKNVHGMVLSLTW